MPPTATRADIEAHQKRIEKDEISPVNLPPCTCSVKSEFFKVHAFRERRFLIIVKMLIQTVLSCLVRFKCPGCGKTFTHYPDFAIPHKHYTRQSVTGFSASYVDNDGMTYQRATMFDGGVPGYPDDNALLAPSTIHRWVTTTSRLSSTCRTALGLLLQQAPQTTICTDLARLTIPKNKYRTDDRRARLVSCRKFVIVEAFFKAAFNSSIFTKLATSCAFR